MLCAHPTGTAVRRKPAGIYKKTDNCAKSITINPATMASALGAPTVSAQ
jgi:hypothetical protein